MTNQDNHPKDAAVLRQKAEALAREQAVRTSEDFAALSPEEIRRMFHELRVHQIELEMQNEALRTAHAEIEAGRARYFDLYDLAPVGYCTLSEQGLILEANLTAATLLGVTRNEMIKQPISRFIFKEDQNIYYLHRKNLFETGEPQECELRMVKPDGTLSWTHLTGTAAQAKDGSPVCRCIINDITGRKLAEELLRESESFLKSTIDGLSAHIAVIDNRGEIILTNKAYRGFAERNCIEPGAVSEGINYLAVCDNASAEHSQEAASFAEGIRAVFSGKLPSFELEYPCHSPDEKRWFVGRVTPIQGEGPRRVIVAHENITERKQFETERQKFFLLAESSSEFIGMCDLDMNPVYVNPAGRRMVGLPDMAAACRVKVQDYYFPEDQRFIAEEFFPRVLRDGHGDVEIRLRHFQTGEPIWMFYYLFSVCDPGGTPVGWATVSRNITERKRAEKKLIKQLDELQRWQDVMLDREDRVIELKKEVNELLTRAGQPPRYPSAAAENPNDMPDGSQPLKEAEE